MAVWSGRVRNVIAGRKLEGKLYGAAHAAARRETERRRRRPNAGVTSSPLWGARRRGCGGASSAASPLTVLRDCLTLPTSGCHEVVLLIFEGYIHHGTQYIWSQFETLFRSKLNCQSNCNLCNVVKKRVSVTYETRNKQENTTFLWFLFVSFLWEVKCYVSSTVVLRRRVTATHVRIGVAYNFVEFPYYLM